MILHPPLPPVPLHQIIKCYSIYKKGCNSWSTRLLQYRIQGFFWGRRPATAGLVDSPPLVQHSSEATKLDRSLQLEDLSLCSLRYPAAVQQSLSTGWPHHQVSVYDPTSYNLFSTLPQTVGPLHLIAIQRDKALIREAIVALHPGATLRPRPRPPPRTGERVSAHTTQIWGD